MKQLNAKIVRRCYSTLIQQLINVNKAVTRRDGGVASKAKDVPLNAAASNRGSVGNNCDIILSMSNAPFED